MNDCETWIRVGSDGSNPKMVLVWVRLGPSRSIVIRTDGMLFVRSGEWDGYGFKTRSAEESAMKHGIVRIA